MDKLKMKTKSKVDVNIEAIGKLFPDTITEVIKGYDEKGNPIYEKAIDFDVLKQELSKVVVEGREERYQMNWPGKRKSILEANTPINKTLRPCKNGSVDFDKTKNLYIEGDNLDVLKLIRETYLNKVKVIYIDPPYNKGKDSFVYNDDFTVDGYEFSQKSGRYDENGNINYDIRKNNESNGRFHSDWLSMMYPRLKLAKDLLSDDGVIFISIDDKEVENLKKICNEVFGEKNFVAQLIWEKKKKGAFLNKYLTNIKEYIVVFAKKINNFQGLLGEINEKIETYPCIKTTNPRGIRKIKAGTISKYKEKDFRLKKNTRISSGNMELIYLDELIIENGILKKDVRIESNWIYTQNSIDEYSKENLIYITQDLYIRRIVENNRIKNLKDILSRVGIDRLSTSEFIYDNNLNNNGWGTNEDANAELHKIFGLQNLFDFPKPSKLLSKLIQSIQGKKDYIVLDFFSGSATTAHAVMQLNAEDGGNRKFIMVQIQEPCDEKSEAYNAGYKNICEIGKERIRRAGEKIKKEHPDIADKLDIGFRVLKVDSSNMKDVFYNPAEYRQDLLDNVKDNVKGDRSGEDLLFQVMLDLGELLSSDIEKIEIEGKSIFNVGQGDIIACFDENITDSVVMKIAKIKPFYAVFRDSSLGSDAVAANFEQIFETYSPDTIRKVL